ncbi:MAG: hypothetical protein ACC645_17800, partial [Pirellulales bacterium]
MLIPQDNDAEGLDLDPNDTVVYRQDVLLDSFSILLGDGAGPNSPFQGTGVNPLTVDDPTEVSDPLDDTATASQRAVKIIRNGQLLIEDVDYTLGYSATNDVLLLTPLSSLWQPNSVYEIRLDNTQIADLAGNMLRHNQLSGETKFTIILGDFAFEYGDAPDASYGTVMDGGTVPPSNGARHVLFPPGEYPEASVFLGDTVDSETGGQPNSAAMGDDSDHLLDVTGTPLATSALAPFTIRVPRNVNAPGDPNDDTVALVQDEKFTLRDGTRDRIFAFEIDGVAATGTFDVSIALASTDSPEAAADKIVATLQGDIDAGNLFGFTPRHIGNGLVYLGGEPLLNVVDSGTSTLTLRETPVGSAVRTRLQLTPQVELQVPYRLTTPGADSLNDAEGFTIDDGSNAPVIFEFDKDPDPASGNREIDLSTVTDGTDPTEVRDLIRAAIDQAVTDGVLLAGIRPLDVGADSLDIHADVTFSGALSLAIPVSDADQFTLGDGSKTVTFEFDDNGAVSGANRPITLRDHFTMTVAAIPADGETFEMTNGLRAVPVVFEFDTDFRVVAGRVPVDISGAASVDDVAVALRDTINRVPLGLVAELLPGTTDVVRLRNPSPAHQLDTSGSPASLVQADLPLTRDEIADLMVATIDGEFPESDAGHQADNTGLVAVRAATSAYTLDAAASSLTQTGPLRDGMTFQIDDGTNDIRTFEFPA